MLASQTAMDTEYARRQMIEQQIRTWEVTDPAIIEVLESVPREEFVPAAFRRLAWAEMEIPLGEGRYMLYPMVEGRLLQELQLEPEEEVLEIGTGSGYLTACMAKLARRVTSVEASAALADAARARLERYGVDNVEVRQHNTIANGPPAGQFDAVAVTASLPALDTRLLDALKPGGRLFLVTGQPPVMEACLYDMGDNGTCRTRSVFETCLPRLPGTSEPPPFSF